MWRKRALASVGVAAVVASAGVALASSASAATPLPTLALSAPPQVYNAGPNGTTQPVTVVVDNSAVGALNLTGSLTVTIAGVPTGVACANVILTATGASPTLLPDNPTGTGTCTYTAATVASNAAATDVDTYDLSVNTISLVNPNGASGTLTTTASYAVTTSGNTNTVTSNAVSSALAGPKAPTLAGTAGPATIYRAYNTQVINPGLPTGTVTVTDVSASNTVTASTCNVGQPGAGTLNCFNLDNNGTSNNGLQYNQITGSVFRSTPGAPFDQPNLHPDTYQINENNTGLVLPTAPSGSVTATVVIPVLFSDVPATDQFANAIYTLGFSGILNGYADGTFRPNQSVTREAFSHFVYQATNGLGTGQNDGPCTTIEPSAYSDVKNSSPFCKGIRDLTGIGIINGYADGNFHPSQSISRQAVAALIFRFYNYETTGAVGVDAQCSTPTGFNDVTTSNPFCGDIEFLARSGFAKGYADGGYHPLSATSRQAVAQFLYNVGTAVGAF